jgi:hypothetical protein
MAPSTFYGLNFTTFEGSIDLPMLQLGKTQYINRQKSDSRDNVLFFTVYNFDPPYRCIDINYKITIEVDMNAGINYECYDCQNGGRRKYPSQSCICDRCSAGFYGPDCSINMLSLTKGQPTTAVINGPGMVFFMLE